MLTHVIQESKPEYLEQRAIEFIREAQIALQPENKNGEATDHMIANYESRINNAIMLLNLAKLKRAKQ